MSYKKIITTLFVLCEILACISCSKTHTSAGQPFTSIDPSSIAKIVITDGRTNDKYSIEDTTQIGEIIKIVNDFNLKLCYAGFYNPAKI